MDDDKKKKRGGWKMSDVSKEKIRQAFLKRGHMSEETRKKISIANTGYKHSDEAKEKLRLANIGKKIPDYIKKKISITNSQPRPWMRGEKSPLWIKDRTLLKKRDDKRCPAYRYWKKIVRDRDNWKCRINNKDCVDKLETHHILSWRDYPELRFDINNGITLCKFHHPIKRSTCKEMQDYFINLICNKK
jgi:phage pi2 protein 07